MQVIAYKTSEVMVHMVVSFTVTMAFTGSFAVGGVAAVVEPICTVALMPLHDRIWEKIRQKWPQRAAVQVPSAGQHAF